MSQSPTACADTRVLTRKYRWTWAWCAELVAWVGILLGIGERFRRFELSHGNPEWGGLPGISLIASFGLLLIALAHGSDQESWPSGTALFCAGLVLILLPIAVRIAWPSVSRFERIGLLLIAALSLCLINVLSAPLGFSGFDEFLHWITADDIMRHNALFTPNQMLPISPLYPALEIITTALSNLTNLSIFASGTILILISRMVFIGALFLFFEAITSSSRLAAVACFIYMGNASMPLFHASFAYEGLAIVFMILAFLGVTRAESDAANRWMYVLVLTGPFLAAMAVSHHTTAFIGASLLLVLTCLTLLSRSTLKRRLAVMAVLATAIATSWGWLKLMGNPVTEYIGPSLEQGVGDLLAMITSMMPVRKPFLATDGATAPIWQRLVMMCAIALTCLGLALGFFRAFSLAGLRMAHDRGLPFLRWTSNWILLLTLLTLAFPITLAFRFTDSAWELGNRLGPFIYIGIGLVIACFVAGPWLGRSSQPWRAVSAGAVMAILVIGSIFIAWGGPIDFPRRYKVIADSLSIEPMGIGAAEWTLQWLGSDHRFVADRVNRTLLATYGRQEIVTTLNDQIDTSSALFSQHLGPQEIHALKSAHVDFLFVDMRMTQALPRMGVYFERGEDWTIHAAPPEPAALLKFNRIAQVGRTFDNGYIVIFDVRKFLRRERDGR